jgi:malonyl-CoA decarboxylase
MENVENERTGEEQSFFHRLFRSVAVAGRGMVDPKLRAANARRSKVAKLTDLCRALLSEEAEPSAAALALDALALYRELDDAGCAEFFEVLATGFEPAPDAVMQAIDAYRADPTARNLSRLSQVAEAPRQELFRRLNMAPGGTAALVELRERLLRLLTTRRHLRPIDEDLIHLFRSWFNRGFLTLRRISWQTPALILEKLIRYEAVHAIDGWDDLRRRLANDRRCFAFFHPSLPDEPLIFVEIALVRGLSDKVQPLLDRSGEPSDPARADTAIFYSISDCQGGLRGISFGNFLIKQVAAELGAENPRVRTFATLSPIPGFRRWIEENAAFVATVASGQAIIAWAERTKPPVPRKDAVPPEALREPLSNLCAHYLVGAKRRDGMPADAVARFHLRNGARLERVNWAADGSARGLAQSGGLMVNYQYRLDEVERNHEAFVRGGKVIASSKVERQARQCVRPAPVT